MPKINANAKGGGDFEQVPAGVHFAICTKIIYLGFQAEEYEGREKILPKVRLEFELPDLPITYKDRNNVERTAPMKIGRTFTLNIGDKSNLGPFLTSWRGKPFTDEERESFDVTRLAGQVCQLQVIHKKSRDGSKTYANISAAIGLSNETKAAIKAGTRSTKPSGDIVIYSPDEHDQAMWEQVPEWLQKIIENRVQDDSHETGTAVPGGKDDFDDDIPF